MSVAIPAEARSARPLHFAGCFGWLHPAPGSHGVVVCGTVGREGTWTYRAWAALAADLAAAGLPTLRFDYPDMGDSQDLPPGADAVQAWIDSVGAAVAVLRDEAGVGPVSLVGYRLGALLAAEAARSAAQDVAALALLAPVFAGRSFVRELKLATAERGGAMPDGGMEVHGHVLSPATLAHLDKLRLAAPPGRPLLLCGNPELNALQRLAREARAAGGEVTCEPFPDAARLQGAAHEIGAPEATFTRLATWLAGLRPAHGRDAPTQHPASRAAPGLVVPHGHETPVCFGPGGRAFGILCEPRGRTPDARSLLILNTGGNHRTGEARFAVQFARVLAARGIASLRIDAYRTGDTLPPERGPHDELYSDRIAADVEAAIDLLAARAPGRHATFGICSGAYVALHTALRDSRVADVVMVNPPKFVLDPGEPLLVPDQQRLRHVAAYRSVALRRDTWRRVLRKDAQIAGTAMRLLRHLGARGLRAAQAVMPPGVVLAARVVRAQDQFRRLRARGVRVWLVMGDADGGRNELESLFGRAGGKLPRLGVSVRFIAGTDHTLTTAVSRVRLLEAMEDFLPPAPGERKDREAERAPTR